MKLHKHILLGLIPAHILFAILAYSLPINFATIIVAILLWIVIGGIGLDIGLHRILSHKQFIVSKPLERLISFLGVLSLNGSPISWRALHVGYHHPYSDTPKDFHSPVNGGFFNAYVLYINQLDKMVLRGCKELLNDKYQVFFHEYYFTIIWLIVALAGLISLPLCLALLTAMIISFHQTAIVNAMCHYEQFGYATFETKDRSRNIKWLGYITFGLALHNNHHMYPAAANYAMSPGEYDVGYRLAKFIGLTENKDGKYT